VANFAFGFSVKLISVSNSPKNSFWHASCHPALNSVSSKTVMDKSKSAKLFDHCAECRRCCHVDEDYPPLEVTLTKLEKKKYGSVCIESRCEHLGPAGCVLGDEKPFSCRLYPLAYDPANGRFYYDDGCPLMPAYIAQLGEECSDASKHLEGVSAVISGLQETDRPFLKRNFLIDTDYFELKELPLLDA